MLLGVIADDFTGASDIANTIAKGGLKTTQFLGLQTKPALKECEAGVVSLKSRSIPAQDAIAQSLAALEWLLAQGCEQIIFKYCSTFDSTPQGNIGQVGEALAKRMNVKAVVVCPAFPTAGRTIYQGHLFVNGKLLNESGLENHPLNPMSDANLVRWLHLQTQGEVGMLALPLVAQGAKAVRDALAQKNETLVVVDAVSDEDLFVLGEALCETKLITGGSGIALGLPLNFIRAGKAKGGKVQTRVVKGAEAILAGSCSQTTLAQIARHKAKGFPSKNISIEALMAGEVSAQNLCAFVFENTGKMPLIYSSQTPQEITATQAKFGREAVAQKLDALFAETAKALVAAGYKRLVIAGGETSGAVVSALGLEALEIGEEIATGVPILTLADGSLSLALKGGNFGGDDFFERTLKLMEGASI